MIICALLALTLARQGQGAQSYNFLHSFGGTVKSSAGVSEPDGIGSTAGVTFDAAGNMYGTASEGGPNNGGNVWRISVSGDYTVMHDFGGTITGANGATVADGVGPQGGVTFDSVGNMYGTTGAGGSNGIAGTVSGGIIWEITNAGQYLVLHEFGGKISDPNGGTIPDGYCPSSRVTLDKVGNVFGTASYSGPVGSLNAGGMLWELTVSRQYIDLHNFGGTITNANGARGLDGIGPVAPVSLDATGNIFGTAVFGGANPDGGYGSGMVWELQADGTYLDLHDFGSTVVNADGTAGPDGKWPEAGVTVDSGGNLFGTAMSGGPFIGGNVWEISKSGEYKDLHDFGGTILNTSGTNMPDGNTPYQVGVAFDGSGNMFGTTMYGGANFIGGAGVHGGILWEITASGGYVDVHDFGGLIVYPDGTTGPEGYFPPANVAFDGHGGMYGTSYRGGPYNTESSAGGGVVWSFNALAVANLTLSPSSVIGGNSSVGIVELTGSAGTGGVVVALATDSTNAVVPNSVLVPAGASSVSFTITTKSVSTSTSTTITASLNGGASSSTLLLLPLLAGLDIEPASVVGGNSATGKISVTQAAPVGGLTIYLASSPGASVPASVTVPASQTSVSFGIVTVGLSKATTSTITATLDGVSVTGQLSIAPATLNSLSISPNTVTGGHATSGTLTLNGASPSDGIAVAITSSIAGVVVPASVTIPSGAFLAQFNISTVGVSKPISSNITATCAVGFQSQTLNILPDSLQDLTVTQNSVVGGSKSKVGFTVTLSGPALAPGAVVELKSSNSKVLVVPASIRIPKGAVSGTFAISHKIVASEESVAVTASFQGSAKSVTLTVRPFSILSLTFAPWSVAGGVGTKGTVQLDAVPGTGSGPVKVNLASSSNSLKIPGKVAVPEGSSTATFPGQTFAVGVATTSVVTATVGASSKVANVTVLPPSLSGLSLAPTSVKGFSTVSVVGTVVLSSPAPAGGLSIALASTNSAVASVPQTVKISAGQTRATFKVAHFAVQMLTPVGITAAFGGTSRQVTLTVKP